MSILVRAEIHGLAGRAAELRDVLLAHVTALAAADGNEGAVASVPLDAEHGELLLEVWWRDEAALRGHYATTEYERYTGAISPLLARPSDVGVHYVDRTVRATADLSADPSRLG
jgi:quinol monooxygenase YgiN